MSKTWGSFIVGGVGGGGVVLDSWPMFFLHMPLHSTTLTLVLPVDFLEP